MHKNNSRNGCKFKGFSPLQPSCNLTGMKSAVGYIFLCETLPAIRAMEEPRMIKQTSPDRIRGKLVKYRSGDCLLIQLNDNEFLGALMSGKFNKYYNLTLFDFRLNKRPTLSTFLSANIFGTRFGSWVELEYAVDQQMIDVKYMDENPNFEKVGSVELIDNLFSAGYDYLSNINQIAEYHNSELPIRTLKTKNADKFPDLAFSGKHLIKFERIINK